MLAALAEDLDLVSITPIRQLQASVTPGNAAPFSDLCGHLHAHVHTGVHESSLQFLKGLF